eukprot:scaffold4272_cov87-Phaeocystis_antarctica.AAC.1
MEPFDRDGVVALVEDSRALRRASLVDLLDARVAAGSASLRRWRHVPASRRPVARIARGARRPPPRRARWPLSPQRYAAQERQRRPRPRRAAQPRRAPRPLSPSASMT